MAVLGTNSPGSLIATNELRDIRPPVAIPTGWEWAWWALGAALVLGAALFLWFYFRNRRSAVPPIPVIPPHVRARERLNEALRLLPRPREFCIEVSDAVRLYLEERFAFHAPERTTEEFLRELQSTDLLTTEQKLSLGDFLERCDLVKFARYEPREIELRDLHTAALRLVDETAPQEPSPATSATPGQPTSTVAQS